MTSLFLFFNDNNRVDQLHVFYNLKKKKKLPIVNDLKSQPRKSVKSASSFGAEPYILPVGYHPTLETNFKKLLLRSIECSELYKLYMCHLVKGEVVYLIPMFVIYPCI